MSASKLLTAAFAFSAAEFPEFHADWIKVSFKILRYVPGKPLTPTVQRCGRLDVLLRSLEIGAVDRVAAQDDNDVMSFDHQEYLSELWIGGAYEICRLAREANIMKDNDFDLLAHQLRLVRVPLEKMQIAADNALTAPLQMIQGEEGAENARLYTYTKGDPNRAHMLPTGMSRRGSASWHVIDIPAKKSYWVERQEISDLFLKVFLH